MRCTVYHSITQHPLFLSQNHVNRINTGIETSQHFSRDNVRQHTDKDKMRVRNLQSQEVVAGQQNVKT